MRLENQLFTESEFQAAKSREKVLRMSCMHCGQEFLVTKHDVQHATKLTHNVRLETCSTECRGGRKRSRLLIPCAACGVLSTKTPSQLKKSKSGRSFCSRNCGGTFNSRNRTSGVRRSKLEAWLEKQLTERYPYLEVHYNRKDAINGELDIYFPSLKIGVELNGIFHYEPIFGEGKLSQTQASDSRKFLACHQAGISLCIIDVSQDRHFTEKKATRYLEIIENIINR